ncbi:hypothetical protein BDF14DRAFT_1881444 [Spinellus fusiger]|nr:hypothetical protein BDF14DRAFT_1881444 [Spinellus fusiger]
MERKTDNGQLSCGQEGRKDKDKGKTPEYSTTVTTHIWPGMTASQSASLEALHQSIQNAGMSPLSALTAVAQQHQQHQHHQQQHQHHQQSHHQQQQQQHHQHPHQQQQHTHHQQHQQHPHHQQHQQHQDAQEHRSPLTPSPQQPHDLPRTDRDTSHDDLCKPTVGSDEWHRVRRENHKQVERRRRETINDGINEIARIVPGCEKNKGSILQRAATYIRQLKENEAATLEKWTLEKLLTDQAINELNRQVEVLKAELDRAKQDLSRQTSILEVELGRSRQEQQFMKRELETYESQNNKRQKGESTLPVLPDENQESHLHAVQSMEKNN